MVVPLLLLLLPLKCMNPAGAENVHYDHLSFPSGTKADPREDCYLPSLNHELLHRLPLLKIFPSVLIATHLVVPATAVSQ